MWLCVPELGSCFFGGGRGWVSSGVPCGGLATRACSLGEGFGDFFGGTVWLVLWG